MERQIDTQARPIVSISTLGMDVDYSKNQIKPTTEIDLKNIDVDKLTKLPKTLRKMNVKETRNYLTKNSIKFKKTLKLPQLKEFVQILQNMNPQVCLDLVCTTHAHIGC